MKKLFTLAAAVLLSVGLFASTVSDLATISADHTVYFEDVVSAKVNAGTLFDSDYLLSVNGNNYATNKGSDANGKLYCLRVKSTSQDVLAFKVATKCTLVLYADNIKERPPFINTSISATDANLGEATIVGSKDGYVTFAIPAAGTYYIIGNGSDCYLAGLEFSGFCTDPELTVSPTEGIGFVGDAIDITISSKNQSKPINAAVTVDGEPGVYGTDYTFSTSTGLVQATPLKAGTFVITFSQASNGTYCDAEESATFVISEKTPVTVVSIDGPTAGYVDQELVYTATAAGATSYQWLVDGIDANTNAAEFTYTGVKGNHSIVCKARNEFNAAEEWIASAPIALTVSSIYGELLTYIVETSTGNIDKDFSVAAGEHNILGGTGHQKTSKTGKLGSNGHYISLTLAKGSFAEGDTVKIVVTPEYNSEKEAYSAPAQLKISTVVDNTDLIGESEKKTIDSKSSEDLIFDVVLTKGASTIYLAREGTICGQNPVVKSIAVVRPMPVKSTVETLTAVTINDEAISAANLATLVSAGEILLSEKSYLNAPVVKFTKHTVITYEDDSQKESDEVIEKTSTEGGTGTWGATATIGENAYTVYTLKQTSYVVTYKFGEETLGTENVAQGGSPAEYAKYQKKSLYAFNDWYNDADLADEHKVANIAAEVINAATTYYAKFEKTYATSVNMEKFAMNNPKGETSSKTLLSNLGSSNYASGITYIKGTNEIDSLRADKATTDRNYPYLGLKVKTSGAMLDFRLAAGKTVKVKFGKVVTTPNVSINGGDYAEMTITDNVYTYTAEAEAVVSIKTADAQAVVFQQIAIGEELAAPELFAISCAKASNGTVSACTYGIPGEKITLTVTPDSGYEVSSVKVNGENADEEAGVYSFEMPSAAANVVAVFSQATAIDNAELGEKAVKVIENGQLIIIKNGVKYNAQGTIVK